jgi:Copper type II ascorbate-dependent monooxygenase, C-terminal domain
MIFTSRSLPIVSRRSALLPLALALAACGSSGEMQGSSSGAGAGPETADTFSFDTASYTVQPGQEVRYMCYTTTAPADKELTITEITPIYGKATHHLGVYSTLAPEPDGVFDCPELEKPTWIPLYGGGVESTPLTMPPGAAMHVAAGQQILVQLHLLNASAEVVTSKASIVFKTSDEPNLTPAGIFGMSDQVIDLPPHSSGVTATMSCPASNDMDVFAVFAHMHQLGQTFEASRGAVAGQDVFFQTNWNFSNQPTTPLVTHSSADDMVTVRCTYDNPGSTDVTYGESTYQEMCAFVLYYTPYPGLNGCLKTTGPQ